MSPTICLKQELLIDTKAIKMKVRASVKKEVPSALLYVEKEDYTLLTKRILDLKQRQG